MRGTAEVRLIASETSWIESAAVDQLRRTATLKGMELAVGLPDLHPGKGTPIGAAFVSRGWIHPLLVGNDIGCGIGLWRTGLEARRAKREAWADRLRGLDGAWSGSAASWLAEHAVTPAGFESALGTVGSGNHFAELQVVDERADEDACSRLGIDPGVVYLCVHSGSRGFGEAILREQVDRFQAAGVDPESEDGAAYLERHEHARRWAVANRALVARRILDCLRTDGERVIDLCHNSVTRAGDRWLHRKGSAPSDEGPVVIPGSRGSATYVVEPTDPGERSAWSLAHGAGRKWSRTDCRARLENRFPAKTLERTALGSIVICEDKALLYEEAPEAYKNITRVMADLTEAGLCRVVAVMKPVVTYKVRR